MIDFVVFIAGFWACWLFWSNLIGSRRTRLINKLPGPPAYPLVGNSFQLMLSTDTVIPHAIEWGRKYGPIFRLWSGPIPIVSLSGPEYIETLLGSNKEIRKSFVYKFVQPWLGLGLLTSWGSRWVKHRKMITPTFHFKILDTFIPIYQSKSEILVEKLAERAETGEVFDIYNNITLAALDIICETAMGIDIHAQDLTSSKYIDAVYRVSNLIPTRFSRLYQHPDLIFNLTPSGQLFNSSIKTLHEFTEKVIRERTELRKNINSTEVVSDDGVKKRKAFLDLLLDAGSDLSVTDIREEVDTFMFEGHDTTTAGISWALYLLGRYPEIQEEVAEEVCALWPEGEDITMQALNEMKLLERVIKETLRIYPSVPFISRNLENDMQFGEYLIPATTTVSVAKVVLHRNPDIYPDPEKFDPDRFLPENIQKRHPYAYVPFSAGPRNCIGQKFAILEEKVVLASVIRAYKITSVEKQEDVVVVSELIQRPKNGIKVKLSKRITT